MTFAPETIRAVRALLKGEDPDLDDNELGIVGGPSHVTTGTSYHLGKDQLIMSKNPYSARTSRDLAGLSNAASALDIDDDLDELRELSVWLVAECRANAPDTRDICEIIYSPDGVQVLQWDRERGVTSAPRTHSDLSHRMHTHISWYRDSEFRDKTAVFRRFYESRDNMTPAQFVALLKDPTVAALMRAFPWQYSGGGIATGKSTLGVLNDIHIFSVARGPDLLGKAIAEAANDPQLPAIPPMSDEQAREVAEFIATRLAAGARAAADAIDGA